MAYFRNFPLELYNFGDETEPAFFQNLTAYIDLIDRTSDDLNYYTIEYIRDGERPDQMSQRIYGTPDYYWTFFFMNEHLRVSGWPIDETELFDKAKEHYPHVVLTTEGAMGDKFSVGSQVIQEATSNANVFGNPVSVGEIVEKNLDMGQIVIKPYNQVRSISVSDGGKGYVNAPMVKITGGGGSGATAAAAVTNGVVTSIEVSNGGKGYTSTPTITIAAPDVINWTKFADDLDTYQKTLLPTTAYGMAYLVLKESLGIANSGESTWLNTVIDGYKRGDVSGNGYITPYDAFTIMRISTGRITSGAMFDRYEANIKPYIGTQHTTTSGVYNAFFATEADGSKWGDISQGGLINADDVKLVRDYAADRNSVNETVRARLKLIQDTIVANTSTYPNWNPGGGIENATATATLTNSNFKENQTIYSADTSANWRDWNVSTTKSLAVENRKLQWEAIHHYEDSAGYYLDLTPADSDGGVLIPSNPYKTVSHISRLRNLNEDLKQIKVLKSEVVGRVNNEFQKLLRNG